MARFKEGDRVYIPSNINRVRYDSTRSLDVYEVEYLDAIGEKRLADIDGESGFLLTADEVAGLLKTKADAMEVVSDSLQEENEKLKTRVERLTTWYEEANRTASEATEANDELKAKIAELRTRNAELEALLKEVTATRDEAIKQNEDLESELEDARHVNEYAVETARSKEKLIGEQRELIKKYGVVIDILIDKITALKKGENDG